MVAIGDPRIRKRVVEEELPKSVKFATIHHPLSYIGRGCTLGEGSVVNGLSVLSCDVNLRSHVYVHMSSFIGHDTDVGKYSVVCPHVSIAGKCRIGEGVFIGMGANIRDGTFIGDEAIIGQGTNIVENVAPKTVCLGNPGSVKCTRKEWRGSLFREFKEFREEGRKTGEED